ncbi:uncharacterized protein ATNIH1004_003578 [Aspergillus tanneri]|uniref:Uncharacterized protein n=1 Tax=Aspergillus tanneri TaxID=1220188 RepID=A0A5M9N1Q0_9EURO|nr:uncharacterized protein ATNIH1004_003578 [Aspergillus tanneri]KAA8650889.1 hypothetical protein ATNIH1004_003578 [Aspergillus tanneri]
MDTKPTYVRPNFPLVPETIKLSPFDQFAPRGYLPLLLFFKTKTNIPVEELSLELKQGLANTLDVMYFLAGYLEVENAAHNTLELHITGDAGVPFQVKNLRDVENRSLDFSELERGYFPPSKLDASVLLLEHLPQQGLPCLTVQANFICGGLILGLNFHHSVVDGPGVAVLWKIWSRQTTAVSEGHIVSASETCTTKALERWPLFPVHGCRRRLCEFPGFTDVQMLQSSGSDNGVKAPGCSQSSGIPTITCWHIPKNKLLELQEKAKPRSANSPVGTENSVLSAFIWRHYTKARCPQHLDVKVALFTTCDARSRLDPPLHPDYPGNAIVDCRALMSPVQLHSSDSDAIGQISSAVMESISWWTPDNIGSLLCSMQAYPRVGDVIRSVHVEHNALQITNISTVPLYSSFWGKNLEYPRAIRPPWLPMIDGLVNISPRLRDGGLEIFISADDQVTERLKQDAEFAEYIQYRCS